MGVNTLFRYASEYRMNSTWRRTTAAIRRPLSSHWPSLYNLRVVGSLHNITIRNRKVRNLISHNPSDHSSYGSPSTLIWSVTTHGKAINNALQRECDRISPSSKPGNFVICQPGTSVHKVHVNCISHVILCHLLTHLGCVYNRSM